MSNAGRRQTRARLALRALVATVALTAGLAVLEADSVHRLELHTVDWRFAVRGERPPPRDIVVVEVGDDTFSELGLQWPFPRSVHGRVIDRLSRDGARRIAYDVQFTEASDPDEDFALFEAVRRAGNVVLGTTEVDERGGTNVLGGDENLRAAGAIAANAVLPGDPGGVMRRVAHSVGGLVSFAAAGATGGGKRTADQLGFGPRTEWIDFHGGPDTLRTISFSRVLKGRFRPGTFRGATVVVGASAPSLQDVHPTSTSGGDLMPGPQIHAEAIDTVRRGLPLTSGPRGLDFGLVLLLALAAPLAGLRWTGVRTTLAVAVVLLGFLALAQALFASGTVVAVAAPFTALLIGAFGGLLVHYLTEVRERQRARTAFARFVPAPVVDQVLERADDELRLGGEEALGTVMFSDLRGFTTFSERVPAPEVIEILNRYLTEMTDAILAHGGTLLSYLGDGILAVFGAPIPQDDHADRALAAACEMLGPRLEEFNEWAREQGIEEEFRMGIGLNSGVFMAGNVGSEERLQYTAIGDVLNTAARMEGMTKGTPYQLFIAESTRFMLLREHPHLVYVDEMEIRGREATMEVWALDRLDPNAVPAEGGASAVTA